MNVYIVIISDYDYDSCCCDRLISCEAFASHEQAKEYAEKYVKRCCDDIDVPYDMIECKDDEVKVYDDNEKVYACIVQIVSTIVE